MWNRNPAEFNKEYGQIYYSMTEDGQEQLAVKELVV